MLKRTFITKILTKSYIGCSVQFNLKHDEHLWYSIAFIGYIHLPNRGITNREISTLDISDHMPIFCTLAANATKQVEKKN